MSLSLSLSDSSSKRINKGVSLLEALNDYIVLDLETTGLDPHFDSIIELAALKIENNKIVDRFQSLVNPCFEIDEFITELTGITNEMLSKAPSIHDILPQFLSFIGKSIVVAHNANFDINFIYDTCSEFSLPVFSNNFVDTMRVSRRLFREEKHHRLSDLIFRFGISDNVEHRALSDSIQTFECYEYMKQYALDNNIDFHSLYPTKYIPSYQPAKNIKPQTFEFNESSPIFKKTFVFTGVLEKMSRAEAMQIVVNIGGLCADNVTKKTNYLVLGNNDYCPTIKGGKSRKQKMAERYKILGVDIEIISENVFYEMISDSDI